MNGLLVWWWGRLNRFKCGSLGYLQAMVRCVTTACMKHIKHLDFELYVYGTDEYCGFKSAMKKLFNSEKLDTLTVSLTDHQWLRMPKT